MNGYFQQIGAIAAKDFSTEFKTRELFSSMFVFGLLVILIFIFSVDLSLVNANAVGPGVLWVAILFAGTLGLNRSFTLEKENGCLQGLILTPVDRSAIYFGKMVSNLVFLLVMEAFLLPVFMVFFNIDLVSHLGPLLVVLFLGTLGFSALGTLLSSLSSNLKTREIMLPILLYPLMVPIAIGSVRMTSQILMGKTLADNLNWLGLTLCFDVIYIGVSIMTIDYIFEE
ncbi:heme exporter protein CcmB [Nitrospina gracilis]|uniref:heme exporter protein CcmB n=1 Tax=Nitrospina gracilis TaxID=35801 RepID=UPI001F009B85|nr:heme exporter protein CcmB [Nitrospina gracilis]MCF8720017.1 heme exporter protein B [Nitrospina gracilis Nb-211]